VKRSMSPLEEEKESATPSQKRFRCEQGSKMQLMGEGDSSEEGKEEEGQDSGSSALSPPPPALSRENRTSATFVGAPAARARVPERPARSEACAAAASAAANNTDTDTDAAGSGTGQVDDDGEIKRIREERRMLEREEEARQERVKLLRLKLQAKKMEREEEVRQERLKLLRLQVQAKKMEREERKILAQLRELEGESEGSGSQSE